MQHIEMTSHTMLLACQMIQPGEVAPAHRHTMAAIRFIVQGQGAYTVVNGEKLDMAEGDLILTPQWTWHDHGHEGSEPMVWLDGLDVPLIQSLQVISYEPYSEEKQATHASEQEASHFGMTRPVRSDDLAAPAPLHYRWEDTYRALQGAGGDVRRPLRRGRPGIRESDDRRPYPADPVVLGADAASRASAPGRTATTAPASTTRSAAGGATVINGETTRVDQGRHVHRAAVELARARQPVGRRRGDPLLHARHPGARGLRAAPAGGHGYPPPGGM